MTILNIVTFPDKVLRADTETISNFDHELSTLVDNMVETMRVAPGVGLAAPQVGVSKKLVVVEFGSELDESFPNSSMSWRIPKSPNALKRPCAGLKAACPFLTWLAPWTGPGW